MKHWSMRLKSRDLLAALDDQAKWIAEHGADREGYIARYGSKTDSEHYGDGGEAIYNADKAHYDRMMVEAMHRGLFQRGNG